MGEAQRPPSCEGGSRGRVLAAVCGGGVVESSRHTRTGPACVGRRQRSRPPVHPRPFPPLAGMGVAWERRALAALWLALRRHGRPLRRVQGLDVLVARRDGTAAGRCARRCASRERRGACSAAPGCGPAAATTAGTPELGEVPVVRVARVALRRRRPSRRHARSAPRGDRVARRRRWPARGVPWATRRLRVSRPPHRAVAAADARPWLRAGDLARDGEPPTCDATVRQWSADRTSRRHRPRHGAAHGVEDARARLGAPLRRRADEHVREHSRQRVLAVLRLD